MIEPIIIDFNDPKCMDNEAFKSSKKVLEEASKIGTEIYRKTGDYYAGVRAAMEHVSGEKMETITISKERYEELCSKESLLSKVKTKYKVEEFLNELTNFVINFDDDDMLKNFPSYKDAEKYLFGEKVNSKHKELFDDFCESLYIGRKDGTTMPYLEYLDEKVEKFFN